MIHPLLRLAASQPHLLGDHVGAYASLVTSEVGKASTAWITRIGLLVAGGVLGCIGLILVGVALLLCAALPASDFPAPWALFVIPLTPIALAGACALFARSKPIENAFAKVKHQLDADLSMLREVGA